MESPGYRTKRSAEYRIKTNQPADIARLAALDRNWRTLVDEGFIIAGSPATVADRLIEAAKGLRVGNIMALMQIGSMPHELTKKNLTLYAEEVMPRVRTLWQDEGWEHRWWPQGARQVAAEAVAGE
jgi:alkanesulfonate monooxygenase SsuD/methylene tetrahydromethanopterin reductase-like flavin-dependent oxidoreductase (luciferase family)